MNLVVLGMHRSGTSLLVGLLELHGYTLGAVSEQTSRLKPTGTKENLDIRKLNNQLFARAGSDWQNPKLPTELPERLRSEMQATADFFHHTGQWAIKDPRMVFSYDLWRPLLPDHQIIGTYRDPHSVVGSLVLKNGLQPAAALDIWYRYNERLLSLWNRQPFPVLPFNESKDGYLEVFARLMKRLGINLQRDASEAFFQHPKLNQGQQLDLLPHQQALHLRMSQLAEQVVSG